MATPPARVALSMSSISMPRLRREVNMKVERQLPVSDSNVLATIWFCSKNVCAVTPKLKEGQNSHRNKVPIIANRFET